jgi:hypothetical protein
MNITELKSTVHSGLGGHIFRDRSDNSDITDQTLVNSINVAQLRIARRLVSGELYFEEILFVPSGTKTLTHLTNIRNLIFVSLNTYTNVEYDSQVTDLPNGIYVNGTTVYQISYSDKRKLFPASYFEFEELPGNYNYETNEPRYYKLFQPNNLSLDVFANSDYFIWMSGTKWPDLFTTSSTTEEPDLKNIDDLIVLQAQIYIYTSILKDAEKANHLFSVFQNELGEHNSVMNEKANKEFYVKSHRMDCDSEFPRHPRGTLSESDLGIE